LCHLCAGRSAGSGSVTLDSWLNVAPRIRKQIRWKHERTPSDGPVDAAHGRPVLSFKRSQGPARSTSDLSPRCFRARLCPTPPGPKSCRIAHTTLVRLRPACRGRNDESEHCQSTRTPPCAGSAQDRHDPHRSEFHACPNTGTVNGGPPVRARHNRRAAAASTRSQTGAAIDTFNRAYAVCMEGRVYTIK
jgi:hypothetical protein